MEQYDGNTLVNETLERNLLGCCLMPDGVGAANVMKAMSAGVKPGTFAIKLNGQIFEIMAGLASRREAVDLMTVSARLPAMKDDLAAMMAEAVSDAAADDWAGDLVRLAAARKLANDTGELLRGLADDPLDTEKHLAFLDGLRGAYSQTAGGHGVKTATEAGRTYLDRLSDNGARKNVPILLGADMHVFNAGELFVLGGDTGAGKTALAAGAVNAMIDAGLSVVYACCESGADEILARIVAARCGVPHYLFMNRDATEEQWKAHNAAFQVIKSQKLAFHCLGDGLQMTPSGIAASVRRMTAKWGKVDVIVIDFLQGFRPDATRRNGNKTSDVEDLITGLHDLFAEVGAAGLVLCQYSRQGQEAARRGEEPQLNWLRDCGAIENLAHVVAHIVKRNHGGAKITELVCNQKSRNCPPFKRSLAWNGAAYVAASPSPMVDAADIPPDSF